MSYSGENARGVHAIRVLRDKTDFTIESLIEASYDSYLTAFEDLIPSLLRAYDRTSSSSSLKARLSEQIGLLRNWDLRFSVESVPTSLAIFWAQALMQQVGGTAREAGISTFDYMAIGEGAVAAAAADTALGDEKDRSSQLTPTQVADGGVYKKIQWEATFTAAAGNDAITEMGMFDAGAAGNMFNRVVFTARDNENNDLKITYTLTVGSS